MSGEQIPEKEKSAIEYTARKCSLFFEEIQRLKKERMEIGKRLNEKIEVTQDSQPNFTGIPRRSPGKFET